MATGPNVFNIPASAPFLRVLIDALRSGRLVDGFPASRDPLELARATFYLPTRRACRMARDAFLSAFDGQAVILPRIVALGDLDEDEIIFAEAATAELAEEALALPPAIDQLERRLLLTQLIARWAEAIRPERGAPLIANTPAAALKLADDLARLIDDAITRKMDWQRLDSLVPDQFDKYWQHTLDFLKIARSYWPERLREIGVVDAADPPQGAVVWPGLDMELDEESWRRIASSDDEKSTPAAVHPQFAMQALRARMGIARHTVKQLADPAVHGRETLISETMRPATTTDRWQFRFQDPDFTAAADRAMA